MYKYFGIKLHSKFILNIKKEFYKKYFKNKIRLIIPVDQQISNNINKVLDKFNLTLEQKNRKSLQIYGFSPCHEISIMLAS